MISRITAVLFILSCFTLQAEEKADIAAAFSKVIKDLSNEDFQTREKASAVLRDLPGEAFLLAEAELKKPGLEAEVQLRLKSALPVLRGKYHRITFAETKKKELAWNMKTMRDAYLSLGHHDPKWDTPAREAMERAAAYFVRGQRLPKEAGEIVKLCQKCFDAGSDDAMLRYLSIRFKYDEGTAGNIGEQHKRFDQAAEKLRNSKYPAIRRFNGINRAGAYASMIKKPFPPEIEARLKTFVKEMVPLIQEALADKEMPRRLQFEMMVDHVELARNLDGDRKKSYDTLLAALPTDVKDGVLGLALKGKFFIKYAWDARGGGYANTVTDEGWKNFRERLALGREALEKAFALDPMFSPISEEMLTIELGQGGGREKMEEWYNRARQANPDSIEICNRKLYYLEPKWHGSKEEMLEYGREMVAEGNWEARLPFILVNAHVGLARHGDPNKFDEHYKDPAVWEDLKSVYVPYLEKFPKDTWDRSGFACYAGMCGKWDEAARQFKILGNDVMPGAFRSKEQFEQFKQKAAKAAGGVGK